MGGVVSCCCRKTSNKYKDDDDVSGNINNSNKGYYAGDNSPIAFDNQIHVSTIYGNNADVELHPSDNPTTSTIFSSMLQQTKESFQHQPPSNGNNTKISVGKRNSTNLSSNSPNRTRFQRYSSNILQKHSNSCSTIYIDDSTVSQPNLRAMIKCVSIAVHSHILHRKSNKTLSIFDEKLHPLTKEPVPDDYDQYVPEQKTIYRFLRILFTAAQLTAECAIVTLVYLERVLSYGELDLCPSNWKRLVLGAVMLASKVWDDQAVWNVDFCQILKDITVNEMNELEREYLQLIQFNVDVGSSIYAKYYFDLRQLAKENKISFPDELLTKEKAIKLEASSLINNPQLLILSSSINQTQKSQQNQFISTFASLKRSASVEFNNPTRKSLLIIS